MKNPEYSDKTFQWGFLVTLLVIISVAFVLLIEPFFGAIVWGVVAAVLFQSVYEKLVRIFSGRTNLAAAVTLVLILVLVIVPTILLGMALVQEALSLYERIQAGEISFVKAFIAFENSLPGWAQVQLAAFGYDDFASVQDAVEEKISSSLEILITQLFSIGQGAFSFLLGLGVMLYLTFFLLRDGASLASRIEQIIPLQKDQRHILLNKFLVVIRATIKGSLVIAIMQGTLGGLIFWALDIRGALLWAVLMGFLSLLPAIGTGIVWLPVAIYLFVTGSVWEAVVLTLCGVFIISMIDNIVRPVLVGRDTRMPDYVVLISTLGGLQLFGINGIVIGPLLAALFIAIWSIFYEARREEATA